MMDFGYPELTNTDQLKNYIVTPVEQSKDLFNFVNKNFFRPNSINAKAT